MSSSTPQLSESISDQLKSALQQAHATLSEHAAHVASAVFTDLDSLQQQFGQQHVRIAVCGEVKAGKSTLLNAIAGAALSPMAFEPLTNVPVRITYGPTTTWRIGSQTVGGLAALEEQMRRSSNPSAEAVVETNLDLLQLGGQVELLDTPGMGSDARMDTVSADALRCLDAIILVVRYPALFTEYTRQLTRGLSHDISKLFVVWNLDASCRSLDAAQRSQHAQTLRSNVSGAHDLFLVDAQRGLEAEPGADDGSGLAQLSAALRDFLNSTSRDLVALREAAKRAQLLLSTAQESLSTRQAMVGEVIGAARRHLAAIDSKAKEEADTARARQAELETAAEGHSESCKSAAAAAAESLRKTLRRARRWWVWNGNLGKLDNTVTTALDTYANAVAQASSAAATALQSDAVALGGACVLAQRPITIPYVAELAPDGRGTLATMGNWQVLRRSLWRGWYLEGLDSLDRQIIADDLAQHAQWLDGARAAAKAAARAATDQRIRDAKEHAAAATAQVVEETQLVAYEAEAQQLAQDVPALDAQVNRITALATRSRASY